MRLFVSLGVLALCVALPTAARACTAFLLEGTDGPRVGKSYDWHTREGQVVHNKAGLQKRALTLDPRDTPHTWRSAHASVTFVQYGRELPNGGMNDAGLVVEILWLNEARPEPRDARPVVNELQWIQLQLDTQTSTRGVVEQRGALRIAPVAAAVHYFVCDVSGDCAVIEPLPGGLAVARGASLPVRAITNDTAAASRAELQRRRDLPAKGMSSLARYRRTAAALAVPGDRARAFALLSDVEQANYTRWQIVYEPKAQRVAFRTTASGVTHVISVAGLPSSCKEPTLAMDLDAPAGSTWSPWSAEANAALVSASFEGLGPRVAGLAPQVAAWPATETCAR